MWLTKAHTSQEAPTSISGSSSLNTENPRIKGKALTSDLKGLWRYRVGDYRILADIQDDKIVILILDIGHRSKIYL